MSSLDDASRKRALESIERNAQAQGVLINDLLDVSRIVSGRLRLDIQTVDLAVVVLAAIDAVRPAVRAKEIEFSVSLAPVTGEVRGDPDRLQQVIWNLLSNAVKFTPPSGRRQPQARGDRRRGADRRRRLRRRDRSRVPAARVRALPAGG